MGKILLLLLFSVVGLHGQNAVYNNFSSTVKGVTIGTAHCYFWFHGSSVSPWDIEVACYNPTATYLAVGMPGQTMADTFNYPGGNIGWLFTSSGGVITFQLTGQGPSDSSPIYVTGTS